MVYRELRETCSKLGEEMFSKSAEAGSKGTNYFSCHKDLLSFHCRILSFHSCGKKKNIAVERLVFLGKNKVVHRSFFPNS